LKSDHIFSDKRDFQSDESRSDAVAPWCIEEVEWLCNHLQTNETVHELCNDFISITGNSDNDKKKKRSLIKSFYTVIEKAGQLEGLYKALSNNIDIALHGRMAASGLMKPLDGALAVAHVITTHAVDADIDWFTAVDDLQEQGSGHLDTQEFSSGVFYRYASLNIGQLQENLGNAPRDKVLDIAAHILHLMATVVPAAKTTEFCGP